MSPDAPRSQPGRSHQSVSSASRPLEQLTAASIAEPQPTVTPISQHGRQSVSSSATGQGPASTQAQSHIQTELESRAGLDGRKRDILESDLAFCTQSVVPPNFAEAEKYATGDVDLTDETLYPTSEMLHLILNSKQPLLSVAYLLLTKA